MTIVIALALASVPSPAGFPIEFLTKPPAMDISALVPMECKNKVDTWYGTGFLIDDKIVATANHVVNGAVSCKNLVNGLALTVYKTDKAHDLALVTGPGVPKDVPPIKISCQRFKTGQPYLAYGITSYAQKVPIIRNNVLIPEAGYTPDGTEWEDHFPVGGTRIFDGYQAPGMSGGPVADLYGYAHGLVTGGNAVKSAHFEFADGMLCKP